MRSTLSIVADRCGAGVLILGVVGFSALLGSDQSLAQDRASTRPAELAAKRLAWELETRKSVDLRTRMDIIPSKVDPLQLPTHDAVEDHYIETAIGQRKCESRYLLSDAVTSRYTHFSDGPKCADVFYSKDDLNRPESIVIKRQYFMEDRSERPQRPQPLQLLYVGREPLYQALPKAVYIGEGQVINRDCDVFLFTQVRWEVPQDHVYYLDKATSIPLKVESFQDQSARDQKKPLWVWTAESLDKIQGHFVPLKSRTVAQSDDPGSSFTWTHRVQSIEFDNDFPATIFWPVLDPGVWMLDTISNKKYRVPGGQSETPSATAKAAEISQPVRAAPPSDWNMMISAVVFGLATVSLVSGSVLWWRQRRFLV
jgi:hypothetical protein